MDFSFSEIEIGLLSGFGLCFLFQMIYYLYFLAKPLYYRNNLDKGLINKGAVEPPVSVIICAKNESENLSKYLPYILEQDYPQFEVIVINDGSTDETELVLGVLESRYPHLYQTYSPQEARYVSRKKLSLTIGVKAAKYDTLLFTEAFCVPLSKDWLRSMARNFTSGTEIVLGFCGLPKSENFIGKMAAFDNLFSGLKYLSSALRNKPYKGVGGNLAYKKELFFRMNGFRNHLNLHAGEDDLFVNEAANKSNTDIEMSSDSIVNMIDFDFNIWKEIKIRRVTTQKLYKKGPILFWNLETFSKLGFYVFALATLITFFMQPAMSAIVGFFVLIRWLVQGIVINKSAEKLRVESFYWTLPLIDLALPFFNIYFKIYHNLRSKSDYTWSV